VTKSSQALKRAIDRVKNWPEKTKNPNNIHLVKDNTKEITEKDSNS
jgi:hypothetical protein